MTVPRDLDAVTADDGLAPLRVAAVLAHWIPDVGCRITQPGVPALRVATWESTDDGDDVQIHPCDFRRLVLQMLDVHRAGPGDTSRIEVEMFATAATSIGPLGMVRHQLDSDHGILAFAHLTSRQPTLVARRLDVGFDDDRELGVTLVHAHFTDEASERAVVDVLVDLAAAAAVDDLASMANRFSSP